MRLIKEKKYLVFVLIITSFFWKQVDKLSNEFFIYLLFKENLLSQNTIKKKDSKKDKIK